MTVDSGDVIICGLSAVAVYMFLASLFEHKKVKFIHESAVAILIGFIVGLFVFFLFNSYFLRLVAFDDNIVFYILLPPMLFADGYNLKKRRFFQNLYYINIFGLIGTILNFAVFASLIYCISYIGWIRDIQNFQTVRYLETWQILLYASCMCSIDPIATLTEVKPEYQPKLFSIVFGQSLIKDAVTIVLYKSIEQLVVVKGSTDSFTMFWYTPFIILGVFVVIIVVSVLIGAAFAFLLTLLFKHARFILKDKGITEVGLIFLTGFISYLASELLGFSGVITMLFCGITLSHFNTYNMSPQGVQASKVTFETISLIAEGFLFLVLGIVSWQVEGAAEQGSTIIGSSACFIGLSLLVLVIARIVNIFVVTWMFRPCKGSNKWRVNTYELQILFASGLVKGAVPFALITSTIAISDSSKTTSQIIKCSVIVMVFITSIIINAVLPTFIRNRLKKIKENVKEDHPSLFDSLLERERQAMKDELAESPESKRYKSKAQKYWKKFDEGILKPFLIYNYTNRKAEIKQLKQRQRIEELKLHYSSAGEEPNDKKQHVLDPENEQANVFIEPDANHESDEDEKLEDEESKKRSATRMEQQKKKSSQIWKEDSSKKEASQRKQAMPNGTIERKGSSQANSVIEMASRNYRSDLQQEAEKAQRPLRVHSLDNSD